MLTARSIWELEQLRKLDDLLILFTGTRSISSPEIETQGWKQSTHPISFADLQTLDRLSTKVPAHFFEMDSVAFNLNFKKYSSNPSLPIHFSSNLNNVLLYSSQKAGETIKAITARCSELLNGSPNFFSALEIEEIKNIRAKYDIYDHPGHRVIYAVRLHHFVTPELTEWLQGAQARHKQASLAGTKLPIPQIAELAIRDDIPQNRIIAKWVSAIDFQQENQYPGPHGRLEELLIKRGLDLNEEKGHFSLFNPDTNISLPLKSGESTDAIFEAYHLVCK